jgi:uncharacterized protein (TIGR02466 family)
MIIQEFFTNFIASENLTLNNDCIKERCYEEQKAVNDCFKPLIFKDNYEKLNQLYSVVHHKVNEIHKAVGLSDEYDQEIMMAWANIDASLYATIPHAHVNTDQCVLFSGVYYVAVTENTSALEFHTPLAVQQAVLFSKYIKTYNSFTSGTYRYKPKTGDLIIFPSWLQHYTLPLVEKCDDERVSIAFNFRIKPKVALTYSVQ